VGVVLGRGDRLRDGLRQVRLSQLVLDRVLQG
jgi:hypothetical protein